MHDNEWLIDLLVVATFVGFLFLLGAVGLHLYLKSPTRSEEDIEVCNCHGEVFRVLGYARVRGGNRTAEGWCTPMVVRAVAWMWDKDADGQLKTMGAIRIQGKWFNADHWEPVEKEENGHEPQDISA